LQQKQVTKVIEPKVITPSVKMSSLTVNLNVPLFESDMGHIYNSNANYAMSSKGPLRMKLWNASTGLLDMYERTDRTSNMGGCTQKYIVYENAAGREFYMGPWFSFHIPHGDDYVSFSYSVGRGEYATNFQYDTAKYMVKFDDYGRIVFCDRASKEPLFWFDWESKSPWGF
jgi:hypothetical protein